MRGAIFLIISCLLLISNSGLANALVTWETMKIANVGIEGTLWDGGLGFEFDVFYMVMEHLEMKREIIE